VKIQIVMNFALPIPALLGGAVEKRWHGVARQLSHEHDVTIYSCRHPDLPNEEHEGRLRHIRLPGFSWSNTRGLNSLKSARWAIRVAKRIEPGDVLITNDILAPVLLPRLRWHLGLLCVDVQRMPKSHYRWLYRHVDRLYCVSSAVLEEMARVAPGQLPRCKRLANSTDVECFSPVDRPKPDDQRCEILYVGRIHPEKGIDVLIRALALCRTREKLFLRLVGPAVQRSGGDSVFAQRLRSLAREVGLSADEWSLDPPTFDDHALADVYRRGDIFVYPSQALRGETFGIAVLEAMACGKPSIVSGLACFRDMVADGDNGIIVPSHEPAAWARAIDQLAEAPETRARMGLRARALSLNFRCEMIAAELIHDLTELLSTSTPVGGLSAAMPDAP
jgi:glycosyltransferase involved in cell wall biosynthesis